MRLLLPRICGCRRIRNPPDLLRYVPFAHPRTRHHTSTQLRKIGTAHHQKVRNNRNTRSFRGGDEEILKVVATGISTFLIQLRSYSLNLVDKRRIDPSLELLRSFPG